MMMKIRVHRLLISKRLTMRSKEMEEYSSDRYCFIDHHFLTYFTLAWQSNFQILNFYCDHILPSFCQLDLQEAGKLTLKFLDLWRSKKKKYLESFKFPKVNKTFFSKSVKNAERQSCSDWKMTIILFVPNVKVIAIN